jgi:hypothetical protein
MRPVNIAINEKKSSIFTCIIAKIVLILNSKAQGRSMSMNTFWFKIAILAAVVLGAAILLANFLAGGIQEATDFEQTERRMAQQDARLDAELEAAEARAVPEVPMPAERPQQRPEVTPLASRRQPRFVEMTEEDRIAADRLYEMAYTEYKIGRLPTTTFKKMVDYCRELFERYPDSPQAAKARVLMRKLPERFKRRYNVTDEEMGLSEEAGQVDLGS